MQVVLKSSQSNQEGNDLEPWNIHANQHIHPVGGVHMV